MRTFTIYTVCMCFTFLANASEIREPKLDVLKSVTFTSIDDQVKTLGKVDFIIDLSASQDDVFELKLRRTKLSLQDGREVTAFGYHKEAGVIIGAVAPVSRVIITGEENDSILAQFYNTQNEIIAPSFKQIQLFDLDFKPLKFDYQPASQPKNVVMDVSLLIDVSGSMEAALQDVTNASREFLSELPSFTRCSVLTFGTEVTRLTEAKPTDRSSCPESLNTLNQGLSASGTTALHRVLYDTLEDNKSISSTLPKLTIVLTDGQDSQNPEITAKQLIALKHESNSKILIFWAGSYDLSYLKGLADIESVSDQQVKQNLEAFFRSIGISINGLQTITLK
jgi:hypothetical protein